MKKKVMKKSFRRVFSLTLAVMLFASLPCSDALAAEEIETVDENVVQLDAEVVDIVGNPDISVYATVFSEASITVGYTSDGMRVEIATSMTREGSVVGVKDIVIQKKVWYGWTTVSTSVGGESLNAIGSICTILYSGAEVGETYRITCTHYGNVDGYREMANETGDFKYTN